MEGKKSAHELRAEPSAQLEEKEMFDIDAPHVRPRPTLPKKPSSDDLLIRPSKRKTEKKAAKMEGATSLDGKKRPHRFTGRPRGYVRGKVKNFLIGDPALDSNNDNGDEPSKDGENTPTSPESEKDGPSAPSSATSGGVTPDEISSGRFKMRISLRLQFLYLFVFNYCILTCTLFLFFSSRRGTPPTNATSETIQHRR